MTYIYVISAHPLGAQTIKGDILMVNGPLEGSNSHSSLIFFFGTWLRWDYIELIYILTRFNFLLVSRFL